MNDAIPAPMRRRSNHRSNVRSVREIEHSSIDHAFFSCDQIRLRVKSNLKFGCSISLINKRRSITELNSDSRPQHFIVKQNRRQAYRTLRFCGLVPAPNSAAGRNPDQSLKQSQFTLSRSSNAGYSPAFALGSALYSFPRITPDLLPQAAQCARLTNARGIQRLAARGTEFISVSGLCPERSALHSDLRLKRFSGSAAAPVLPHAPMNSPAASCAGFPSQLSALAEGVIHGNEESF